MISSRWRTRRSRAWSTSREPWQATKSGEYLLKKWGRQCAYCDATDVPLEVEHILCRARGGTNRVSNLTLACEPCNDKKGTQLIEDFLKTHWLDAACVGLSTPEGLKVWGIVPLRITATGHGSRQLCRMDEHGFPRTKPKAARRVKGFQTGDLVRAIVSSGTKQGTYTGRVAVRTRGVFNNKTAQGTVTDIHHRFCTVVARSDGYTYASRKEAALPPIGP